MDTPYQDLPQIPASLDGKLKMLREQFDIMMGVIRETLDAPFATEDNLEASILRNVAKDLENLGPEAFQAFEEVKGAHLALATRRPNWPRLCRHSSRRLRKKLPPNWPVTRLKT